MNEIKQALLTGERALFKAENLKISDSVFADGESPLKESNQLVLENDIFKWKYPLWYARGIQAENITLLDTARSGIWYSHHLMISDSLIQAPKTFRRSSDIHLTNVDLPNAQETLWNCQDIYLQKVSAAGDYFGMNSQKITANHLTITGNYLFDGGKNIEIRHSKIISKDTFWNCENVVVSDSTIIGEYLGWNSNNVTFVNCVIESEQGMCYMENVKLINCRVINTDLAFEYSTVDAEITTTVDSIKNPISGKISTLAVEELIFDDPKIIPEATNITTREDHAHAS